MEDQESQQTCKNWSEKRERASGGEEKGLAGAQKVGRLILRRRRRKIIYGGG